MTTIVVETWNQVDSTVLPSSPNSWTEVSGDSDTLTNQWHVVTIAPAANVTAQCGRDLGTSDTYADSCGDPDQGCIRRPDGRGRGAVRGRGRRLLRDRR